MAKKSKTREILIVFSLLRAFLAKSQNHQRRNVWQKISELEIQF